KADLVARVKENGAVFLSLNYTPAAVRGFGGQIFWQQWAANITWADVRVGDFDGDGKSDLVARVKEKGALFVSRNFDPSHTSTPAAARPSGSQLFWQHWPAAITWADVRVGDFDGDGKSDLVARVKETGGVFVSRNFDPSHTYTVGDSFPSARQEPWQVW